MAGIYANLERLARVKLPTGTEYSLIDLALRQMVANDFEREQKPSYVTNDMVIYQNELYVCTGATNGDTFDSTKWSKVTVSSEFKALKEQIAGGIHYRGYTTSSLYENCTTNPIIIGGNPYTAETGDLVIEDVQAYTANKAYHDDEYCTHDGIIYVFREGVTVEQNISWDAISGYVIVKSAEPEFIFDGMRWNELGTTDASHFGDFAYADHGTMQDKFLYDATVTVHGPITVSKKALTTTTITGTNGTQNVTKVTGGDTKDIAKVGTAVRYGTADVGAAVTYGTANRAANGTKVGNADVDAAVTYGTADVGAAVRYGTANVGQAVTYGTADVDTAVSVTTGLTNGSTTSFDINGIKSAELTGTKTFNTDAIKSASLTGTKTFIIEGIVASVVSDELTFTDSRTGTVGIDTESASTGTVGISVEPANKGSFSLTNTDITPAVASVKTLTPAVAAPNDQTLTPATASTKTLTPAKPLSNSSNVVYEAVTSTSTLTPAVAAPNTQTLTPAASNGTLTGSYTLTNYDVAKVADAATTVATGALRNAQEADTNKVVIETTQTTETVHIADKVYNTETKIVDPVMNK